jgi:hypothetical protein
MEIPDVFGLSGPIQHRRNVKNTSSMATRQALINSSLTG